MIIQLDENYLYSLERPTFTLLQQLFHNTARNNLKLACCRNKTFKCLCLAMLKFLTARESGIDSPVVIRRIESTKRAYSLELSKHRDVESVFYGGINSLDIDPVESR